MKIMIQTYVLQDIPEIDLDHSPAGHFLSSQFVHLFATPTTCFIIRDVYSAAT